MLTLGLFCPRAFSAESASSSRKNEPDPQERARTLFKEAAELRKAGKARKALGKLDEAYKVLPTPTLLWPIAELHAQLGQPVEGLQALRRYRQEMAPADMEPGQQQSDAAKLEEKLRAQLAYLQLEANQGATISIDDKEIGRAPLGEKVPVNPGSHRLSATDKNGTAEVTVEVRTGQEKMVPLNDVSAMHRGYFPHPLTWAAIGVTSAFLLTATIVGGIAIAETRSLNDRCVQHVCTGGTNQDILAINSDINAQKAHVTAASAILGVTSVLAVGTAVLIVIDSQRQKSGRKLFSSLEARSRFHLTDPVLTLSDQSAGFALGGRF